MAVRRRLAFAPHADALPILNARRDFYGERAFHFATSRATTQAALLFDQNAPARARRTLGHCPRDEEPDARLPLHLAVSAARCANPTCAIRVPLHCPRTSRTSPCVRISASARHPSRRPSSRCRAWSRCRRHVTATPARTAEPEVAAEQVRERAEDVLRVHVRASRTRAPFRPSCPNRYHAPASPVRTEDFVGLGGLLELGFGLGVFAVAIGVEFRRGLAVGALDVVRAGLRATPRIS